METEPITTKRTRSPAYPAVGLPQAMEMITVIFRHFQAHAAPVEAIGEALEMKPGGSSLNVRLSALKKYGLLEEEENEKTGAKSYRVTALAKDLIVSPKDDPGRGEALRKAALMPTIYDALWSRFGPELPADSLIRAHLVRDRNFNAQQVDGMISDFRATVEFAGLNGQGEAARGGEIVEQEALGRAVEHFATMPRPSGNESPLQGVSRPSSTKNFTIPLEDGLAASIPYPMSLATWELFIQTLQLWKPRLVREEAAD